MDKKMDVQPLIQIEDDEEEEEQARGVQQEDTHNGFSTNTTIGRVESCLLGEEESRAIRETRRPRREHILGKDLIVAVFVVAFDTKKGNIIEWVYPDEINLEGVEFRAMASGFHNVESDFIYFKHNQLFGLSCYEKISVDSREERGARMKSVGLLAVSYSNLHNHMSFLQQQAKLHVNDPSSGYESLVDYFWKVQAPRPPPVSPSSLATADLPHMEITHPSGCFTQFLEYFGPSVFALWRLALLRKRILIFSTPPIGVICYRVYCACLLASHNLDDSELETGNNPLFFINVADIDRISSLNSYIACTTERIFQSKSHLYDIYIDQDSIISTSSRLDCFLRLTPADIQRHSQLVNSQSMAFSLTRSMKDKMEKDAILARFFQRLNTELYQTLQEVGGVSCEDHIMTIEMVELLGLHPKDYIFLTELARLHHLNVTVQRQVDMFSCCI